ncbi:hypothetical protein BDW66DRAFT_87996 [Aspergillus desertorum]
MLSSRGDAVFGGPDVLSSLYAPSKDASAVFNVTDFLAPFLRLLAAQERRHIASTLANTASMEPRCHRSAARVHVRPASAVVYPTMFSAAAFDSGTAKPVIPLWYMMLKQSTLCDKLLLCIQVQNTQPLTLSSFYPVAAQCVCVCVCCCTVHLAL